MKLPEHWTPESNPLVLGLTGKLNEECNELSKVCSRITIQGLHGVDPSSGRTNLEELEREIADVEHMCDLAKMYLPLNRREIESRRRHKISFHIPWMEYLLGLIKKD